MNENENKIDTYIVYSVLNKELNNVEYICYSMKELKHVLNEYKNGVRGLKMIRPRNAKVDIDEHITIMNKSISHTNHVLMIIGVLMLIGIISFILYSSKNSEYHEHELNIYDKSLT